MVEKLLNNLKAPELITVTALVVVDLFFLPNILAADLDKNVLYVIVAGLQIAIFCLCLNLLSLYGKRVTAEKLNKKQSQDSCK